jgi:hypothetical protein
MLNILPLDLLLYLFVVSHCKCDWTDVYLFIGPDKSTQMSSLLLDLRILFSCRRCPSVFISSISVLHEHPLLSFSTGFFSHLYQCPVTPPNYSLWCPILLYVLVNVHKESGSGDFYTYCYIICEGSEWSGLSLNLYEC